MKHIVSRDIKPFEFHGLLIKELTPETLRLASVAEIEVGFGVKHAKARSSKCEKIYICIKGCISFRVGNEEIDLNPMDLLHIPRNSWFEYRNDNTRTAHLLLIHIPPFDISSEEFANP